MRKKQFLRFQYRTIWQESGVDAGERYRSVAGGYVGLPTPRVRGEERVSVRFVKYPVAG